jgi:hypothetical protein
MRAETKNHANLPHTQQFLARVEPSIGHPLDVARTAVIV